MIFTKIGTCIFNIDQVEFIDIVDNMLELTINGTVQKIEFDSIEELDIAYDTLVQRLNKYEMIEEIDI